MTLTTDTLRTAIARLDAAFDKHADELNRLDGNLGDGDLGVTMNRGCKAMAELASDLPDDLGQAFMKCAQAFTKSSGSTYGTILATGLMRAAKACKGRDGISWGEVSGLLGDALKAIAARSKGQLGDKTVLDTLDAARVATEGSEDPAAMHAAAVAAVRETLAQMRNQPARQGRARIFGDKTIGLDDPGMVAFLYIVEALAD